MNLLIKFLAKLGILKIDLDYHVVPASMSSIQCFASSKEQHCRDTGDQGGSGPPACCSATQIRLITKTVLSSIRSSS